MKKIFENPEIKIMHISTITNDIPDSTGNGESGTWPDI